MRLDFPTLVFAYTEDINETKAECLLLSSKINVCISIAASNYLIVGFVWQCVPFVGWYVLWLLLLVDLWIIGRCAGVRIGGREEP